MPSALRALADQVGELDAVETYGRVVGVRGPMAEVAGADVGEAIALHPSAASRPVLGRDINALSKFYRSQKPKNNGVLSD